MPVFQIFSITEYNGDPKPEYPIYRIHQKTKHLLIKIFNGPTIENPDFLWISNNTARIWNPTIQNSDVFVQISNGFWQIWGAFVWISNGWAYGFQILFKIRTIGNLISFWPFKIQTSPDFRSPLYRVKK